MNHSELVDKTAALTGFTKADTDNTIRAMLTVVADDLRIGSREVSFLQVGKLTSVKKPGRVGRNPRTGESVVIPAKNVARFKASSGLVL